MNDRVLTYEQLRKYRLKDRWWDDHLEIPWRVTARVRVLMVTDGARYGTASGYNLSRVLEALQHDLPSYVQIQVTRAQHATSSANNNDPDADLHDLRFNAVDLSGFDQIWIFGVNSGNSLIDGEATALWEFMQGGGGVFATGDHEALGVGLCGRIPRVRSMRRWFYPNPGPNGEPVAPRRDVTPGVGENDSMTGGSDFDGVPQVIEPRMYSAHGPFVFSFRDFPHPVLCGKSGVITRIPDHMHEGRVEVPSDLNRPISVDGTPVTEYPRQGKDQVSPEVIAKSTVNRNPALGVFGVIGTYDGHLVDEITGGVGRVLVDATWHHFWNMNVDQFADASDRVRQAALAGLAPAPQDVAPAEAWTQIREYFQNIALWLARKTTQAQIRRRGIWLITHHVDVLMALKSDHTLDRVGQLLDLGAKAKDALQQQAPQCERLRMTWDWLDDLFLIEITRPWRIPIPDPPPFKVQVPLLDGELLELVSLGAIVESVSRLTSNLRGPEEVEKLLDSGEIEARVAEAATEGIAQLSKRVHADMERVEQALTQRQR